MLGTFLTRDAVSFEGKRLDIADLMLLGLITGTWRQFERAVVRGLELERAGRGAFTPEELNASGTEFRRVTLTRAGITRMAAAHRLAALGAQSVVDERVQTTVADALGRHAAGLPALGPEELTQRLARLWAYEDALAAVRVQVAEPDALRRRLADHRLDWLRVEGWRLRFAEEDAAREARLLIKDDGLDAEEVGLIAGTAAIPDSMYLDQLSEPAAGILAATAPGEVAAPWLQDELWNVLIVSAKTTPSEADPVLRERATDELAKKARRCTSYKMAVRGCGSSATASPTSSPPSAAASSSESGSSCAVAPGRRRSALRERCACCASARPPSSH
jgi:hypothetical protein